MVNFLNFFAALIFKYVVIAHGLKNLVINLLIILLTGSSLMSAIQLTSFFNDESAVFELIDYDEEGESKKELDDELEKEIWYTGEDTESQASTSLKSNMSEHLQLQYSCDFTGRINPPPEHLS
jgi:hypothetical protein